MIWPKLESQVEDRSLSGTSKSGKQAEIFSKGEQLIVFSEKNREPKQLLNGALQKIRDEQAEIL